MNMFSIIPLILIILHIVLCIITYILLKTRILKSRLYMVPVCLFVPVFGFAALFVQELVARGDHEALEEVGIEKLKINDEIYRSIMMDESQKDDELVPLEEALIINDNTERRDLMLEVMYSDPGNYVDQLKEARSNDDTEVVHYAVTALVELQKDYDLKFQELSAKLVRDPDNEELLDENIQLSENYLNSGLLEGNAEKVQLRNLSELLNKKLERHPDLKELYQKKADADLRIGELSDAYVSIQTMMQRWPRDEKGYLLLIRYHAMQRNRKGIDQAMALIRQRQVYLSPDGRNVVDFWTVE